MYILQQKRPPYHFSALKSEERLEGTIQDSDTYVGQFDRFDDRDVIIIKHYRFLLQQNNQMKLEYRTPDARGNTAESIFKKEETESTCQGHNY